LKVVSGKKFCRILESEGWELKRVNGSHRIYAKAGAAIRISVPVHGNTPLKLGLQKLCKNPENPGPCEKLPTGMAHSAIPAQAGIQRIKRALRAPSL